MKMHQGVYLGYIVAQSLRLRSVVNSGHQMSRLPSVVDRIDSQRPLGRDSPAFSGVSADCRKALCIL